MSERKRIAEALKRTADSIVLLPGTEIGGVRADGWVEIAVPTPGAKGFRHAGKGLVAIRAQEMGRWHMSVSHADRVPTWGEIGFARDSLLPPDVWLMIAHPPRKYWLNYDRRVLHLWEFRDPELIEQFRLEGEQAARDGKNVPDSGEE